jgi:RND family efflux transporter MFP subunit
MTRTNTFSLLYTGLLLAVAAGLISCASGPKQVSAAPEIIHEVTLVTAQERKVPDTFDSVGTVHAQQSAQVASQVTGYVVAVNVHEGNSVRQGQTLAIIDDVQLRSGVAQAQAADSAAAQELAAAESEFALAKSTFERYQSLYEKRSLSPQEYDEVKTRLQSATARRDAVRSSRAQAAAALQQSQTILDHTRIRAPFNGVVTARQADPGALATPGMVLLAVDAAGQYRLDSTIDESDLKYVRLGQITKVTVEALDAKPLDGKVTQIVPAVDPASRSFTVKVGLPANPALRSGLFGRAQFTRGEHLSLLVPQTAIVHRGQLHEVFVVGEDKVATLRYITLGTTSEDQVEVLSGLSPGEMLIAAPGDRDLGGKRIEAR